MPTEPRHRDQHSRHRRPGHEEHGETPFHRPRVSESEVTPSPVPLPDHRRRRVPERQAEQTRHRRIRSVSRLSGPEEHREQQRERNREEHRPEVRRVFVHLRRQPKPMREEVPDRKGDRRNHRHPPIAEQQHRGNDPKPHPDMDPLPRRPPGNPPRPPHPLRHDGEDPHIPVTQHQGHARRRRQNHQPASGAPPADPTGSATWPSRPPAARAAPGPSGSSTGSTLA